MRSVTSCFNSTLYRKTMTRFWPLWAAYGVFWLFLVPLNMLSTYLSNVDDEDREFLMEWVTDLARTTPGALPGGVWLAAGFGLLCAMAVFGYLFNNRSVGMMHTLPMRREGLFLTQYLAGLSFWLLPLLVVAAVTAALEMILIGPSALSCLLVWLAGHAGACLFFYSFAVFCAMFTGHALALPAFYAILNGLVLVISQLLAALMEEFFYGYETGGWLSPIVEYLTPLYSLTEASYWHQNRITEGVYEWYLQSPATLAAYAGAGVVLAALALMVYRCRHAESAGDVVSIPLVRPIFKIGVSFCTGLCLGVATSVFFNWADSGLSLSVCIVLWSAVGWFAAEMLLKKTFRVFRAWKGCAAMAAAMVLLCVGCFLDVLGIESRVPQASQVETLKVNADMGYPYDSGNFQAEEFTDPEDIQRFLELHQAILREKERAYGGNQYEPGDSYIYVNLTYTLKDGTQFRRNYHSVPVYEDEVEEEGTLTWMADQLVRDRELMEECYGFDRYEDADLLEVTLNGIYDKLAGEYTYLDLESVTGQDLPLEELWQAVRADFDAGTIGRRALFEAEGKWQDVSTQLDFEFVLEPEEDKSDGPTAVLGVGAEYTYQGASGRSVEYVSVSLNPEAEHTLAWLSEYNILTEDGRYSFQEPN